METDSFATPPLGAATPRARRDFSLLAWLVIVSVLLYVILHTMFGKPETEEPGGGLAIEELIEEKTTMVLAAMKDIYARQGMNVPMPIGQTPEMLEAQTPGVMLRHIVQVGEVESPARAVEHIQSVTALAQRRTDFTEEQIRTLGLLKLLYDDYAAEDWEAPALTAEDRDAIEQNLGWNGRLALAPAQGPDKEARAALMRQGTRALMFFGLIFLFGFMLFGTGFVLLVVVLAINKRWVTLPESSGFGGVYAETFAVWLLSYVAIGFVARQVATEESILLWNVAAQATSLLALLWLPMRGVPIRQAMRDIGWTPGRWGVFEPFAGLIGYAMGLPLLAVGAIITVILFFIYMQIQQLTGGGGGPAGGSPMHPIIEPLMKGDPKTVAMIFLLACVGAPLLEETMFRGVLYRHMRDWRFARGWGSAAVSATLSGVIFASVHPQGLLALPALTAIGMVFALIREQRGSCHANMFAHMCHNGIVLAANLAMLGA